MVDKLIHVEISVDVFLCVNDEGLENNGQS
jgi:hypothetical protein